jgi:glutamate dehydrogenase
MHKQAKSWSETLKSISERALGSQNALALLRKYTELFALDYQLLISPRHALNDTLQLEQVLASNQQSVSLLRPDANHPQYRLHFYSQQQHYLDEFIPVLENVNLRVMDQVQFSFVIEGIPVSIKSFSIKPSCSDTVPFNRFRKQLLEIIQLVMAGRLENDALNKLVILTGMSWQDCDVLRTYRNYYLQLDHRTSKASIHHALIGNPQVAKSLFDYFEARFRPNPDWRDPLVREEQALFSLRLQLLENMASVKSINDDRILRIFFNLIDATVRSNFHQRRFQKDYFIAIKINSLGVIDMPAPRPQYEIYVHSAEMEGIHLRGGRIARGGIRWSDRIDDFRTEILDLMRTQIIKNALIIPTGAKGGFVVKRNGPEQDFREAGKNAYIRLIRGLLDLTDNYCGDSIICPQNMVIHDDPDPYLVVAADKGTASFSDIANAVAAEYQFWLGDAFASGGSHGYDHKALGITAKGAWECVKRHFRELGKDIQSQPFTVIGIGSMDGDVFGNGMLLSPHIRLLAAFSGQHIFIDPNPPVSAEPFQERRRLFELPGSTWNDYDRKLISAGGGVYSRSDKDIPVSAELRKWLGIRFKSIDGDSLVQYLLKTPVDLLWLGGIGTYVKASSEKHEDVGDRNNDTVRVDACDLGGLVVGEGANLGFTQKARIEYSLRGGRINTDAVDNSAGVDTSDHEVNLKILLTNLHKKNLIADYQSLFINITEPVCQSVLAHNIAQSLCLSLEQRRNVENPALFLLVADRLEAAGFLDRTVESFPLNKEIHARPGQILTRPELAVLMSAAKMYLTQQLENRSKLLQDHCYDPYLEGYFPSICRERFKPYLANHPLANEIKATIISNCIINQAGSSFLGQDDNENGKMLAYVMSYLTFDQVLQAHEIRSAVKELDNKAPAETQYQILLQLEKTLHEFCHWTVMHQAGVCPDAATIENYRHFLIDYENYLKQQAKEEIQAQSHHYQSAGVPIELAERTAYTANLSHFMFMVSLVRETGQGFSAIDQLLNDIDQTLGTRELELQLAKIPPRDYWVRTICNILRADIQQFTAKLIKKMLSRQSKTCTEYLEQHVEKSYLKHYSDMYLENKKTVPANLLAYVLLIRALKSIAES